ncbi:hypothetical protein PV04_04433 [Phialophora macrospora]|uniref:ATP-dependent RNA helicase DHX8 n=1 Tax=Phialophora macrospora TaxID=1851006 RepID=A0A0D2CTK2_9EURO|nr:hypothetical protein PV04_04433 [Phialophora macrospora]
MIEQSTSMDSNPTPDQRAIRAHYDDDCITVYQAYSAEIADAAVRAQKLSASPAYRTTGRMTWIKPSFCWMMYRSGYSYKDARQDRILALRMKHAHFERLLRQARLAHEPHAAGEAVIVQWDPERSPRLARLPYRSLQVGIPPSIIPVWIDEWIERIDDVTQTARKLKDRLDADDKLTTAELVEAGLVPRERPYTVADDIRENLGMG